MLSAKKNRLEASEFGSNFSAFRGHIAFLTTLFRRGFCVVLRSLMICKADIVTFLTGFSSSAAIRVLKALDNGLHLPLALPLVFSQLLLEPANC